MRSRRFAAAFVLFSALSVPALAAEASSDETILVSRAGGLSGASANGDSRGGVATSRDGRYIAFTSRASNLSPDAKPGVESVYLRDTVGGRTILVSRADGAFGAAAADDSSNPSISAGGRFVAFESKADNLSDADNDALTNIYVRDLNLSTTTLVSHAAGGAAADGDSHNPSVAGYGYFVAYDSAADNLSGDADPAVRNVFVWDRLQDSTKLVSRANPVLGNADGPAADADSSSPSISWNGQRVAFESQADNLSSKDDDAVVNIFMRDLLHRSTTLVSCATDSFLARCPDPPHENSIEPAISPNGGVVAFESDADNLTSDANPAMHNVFVRDLSGSTTTLVSRASGEAGAAAAGNSSSPSVSDDGRFVAFSSDAPNLSDQDGATFDVFVRDTKGNLTVLASRATSLTGAPASGSSFSPSISRDGTFVAFVSEADNLSTEDDDTVWNVFSRNLTFSPPPPPPPLPPPPPEHCHVGPCDTGTAGGTDHSAHTGATGAAGHAGHAGASAPGVVAQTFVAPRRQRIGKVFVIVAVHAKGSFTITGTVRMPGAGARVYSFKPVTKWVPIHATTVVRLKLPQRALRAVRKALRRGKHLKARVTSTARDDAGNVGSVKRTIRLKP